jgi:hypothetical protein
MAMNSISIFTKKNNAFSAYRQNVNKIDSIKVVQEEEFAINLA